MKSVRRLITGSVALAAAVALTCAWTPTVSSASPPYVPEFDQTWSHNVNGTFWFGSPGVADLDGDGPSVITGTTNGEIYAYHVSDGSTSSGEWPVNVGADDYSTPATLGSGTSARIYLGLGVSANIHSGGYRALRANGSTLWSAAPYGSTYAGTRKVGLMSSLAVGPLESSDDVIGGAMGQLQIEVNASTGKTNGGFPWLQADTNFSSPAIAPLKANGKNYIIEGGDSTAGRALFQTYSNGGHIRILSGKGHTGSPNLNDGLVCQYNTNQVVQSAPAVGPILERGGVGIVTGTGTYYRGASDTDKLFAITSSCKRAWSVKLDGSSLPSPAIADLSGTGHLDVVTQSTAGTVYAINGATGAILWTQSLARGQGSVTTFQSPVGDYQYVLVPTSDGVYVLDGRDGSVVAQLAEGLNDRNSATVTADPDGEIGITVAAGSELIHYEVAGSDVSTVQTTGAWPMYHHDPQLTGFTGGLSAGTTVTTRATPCTATGVVANTNCLP